MVGFKKTSPLVLHSAITFDATFSEILFPVGSANVGSASLKERVLINLAFLHTPEIGDMSHLEKEKLGMLTRPMVTKRGSP